MIFKKLFGGSKQKPSGPDHIQSSSAGIMVRDTRLDDHWSSKPISVKMFGGAMLPVSYYEYDPEKSPDTLPEYETALRNFLSLDLEAKALATPYVHKRCRDDIAAADWDGRDQLEATTRVPDAVWNHVRPKDVFVTRRMYDENEDLYVGVQCDCDWDMEHGVLLVYRKGKQLTRVSANDGHVTDADALNVPDNQDTMLSAWKC